MRRGILFAMSLPPPSALVTTLDQLPEPDLRWDGRLIDFTQTPNYWLVLTTDWPGTRFDASDVKRECAVAMPLQLINWNALSPMTRHLCRFAHAAAQPRADQRRVVLLLADLMRFVTLNRTTWADLGIDIRVAALELLMLPGAPAMTFSLTAWMHDQIHEGLTQFVVHESGDLGRDPYALSRLAIAELVLPRWPEYLQTHLWERVTPLRLLEVLNSDHLSSDNATH